MLTPPPHIPPIIAGHIGEILKYNWADEERDYRDHPTAGHIFERMRAVDVWLTGKRPIVPDIGDQFDHDTHRHAVIGWLKRDPTPGVASSPIGPDRCPLKFCTREEAEYIYGIGVTRIIILRVADVQVTGRVGWPEQMLASQLAGAAAMAGRPAY